MSLIEPRDTTTDQPVGTQRVRTQSAFIPGSAQVGLPEGAYEFLFEVRSNIRPPQTHPRFRNPLGGYGIFRSRLRTKHPHYCMSRDELRTQCWRPWHLIPALGTP